MDLRFLKSLLNVVDEGSIAAAALQEGLTASAISQRLQALESELQVKLLQRSGRNVRPTPTCTMLLPQIRRLVEDGRVLRQSLSQNANGGPYRLGATTTILSDYIPPIIQQTAKQIPDVALSVHPGTSVQLYRAFLDGALDAVLCVEPPFVLPKSQHFDVLVRHPIGLIGNGEPFGPDRPFIVYDRNAWGGAICWRAIEQVAPAPKILCELDALETIAIMVREGLGVAVLPQFGGLQTRFPDLQFKRVGSEFRALGLLRHSHEVDHPMGAIIKAAFSPA